MHRLAIVGALIAATQAAADPLLDAYVTSSVGGFSTAAQHAADPRYDVAEAHIARIWPEAGDGIWLYHEQAIINRAGMTEAAARAAPYFQRIGHVVRRPDGSLWRANYTISDARRFVGLGQPGYAGPRPTRADVGEAGCANIITPVAAGHFTATTSGCANTYRGAVSLLSLAIITPDTYANWDRGFDAAGGRVWGPADGGYIFRRIR
jgi:hypothetical protein